MEAAWAGQLEEGGADILRGTVLASGDTHPHFNFIRLGSSPKAVVHTTHVYGPVEMRLNKPENENPALERGRSDTRLPLRSVNIIRTRRGTYGEAAP